MKFKIEKGTETYTKLEALWARMQMAHKAALKLVNELRADQWVPRSGLAGGITAIQFAKAPEGWKRMSAKHADLFEPRAKNTLWRDRIKALDVVPYAALNEIVGFKEVDHIDENTGTWKRMRCPGLYKYADGFLLDTSIAEYTPPNGDIVEILESEYNRLMAEDEKKPAAKRAKKRTA